MSLSNTAVPIYYGRFRDDVIMGRTPVNKYIAMEMERIDDLIDNPGIWYDDEAIYGYIAFCETELTLTDGSPMHLLPTFKLWAEQVFAWYYYVERSVYVPNQNGRGGHYETKRLKQRLTKKQYLIVARGAAKSIYDSSIQAYGVTVDPETTHQITVAPTMAQADEVMSPIRTAIARAPGPYFKFLTEGSIQNTTGNRANRQKLCPTKKGIENFLTNSLLEVRPMSIDKLQGLRTKYNTIDEWLSGETREDPIGAIEQGASKLDDYLIIATSSEGTVRNGVGDDIKMELMSMLRKEYINPHVSIWYYRLDDIEEIKDPAMWVKANPNLGKTVTYETYQQDVERAERSPSNRNDIIAKRFGIPLEGYTYFFTYQETIPTTRKRDYWSMTCAVGADLSQGDDFCAFTFLFPLGGERYGIKSRSYVASNSLMKLSPAIRKKYEEFIAEGTLIVLNGTTIDIDDVYDDLQQFIEDRDYDVRSFGYDPYNAKEFADRWKTEYGPYGVEKVIQGKKTESVPLGEIKNLAEERLLMFDEAIMQFCMGNCIVVEDVNGNRQLLKQRKEKRIDNVASLMDAYISYKRCKEMFE